MWFNTLVYGLGIISFIFIILIILLIVYCLVADKISNIRYERKTKLDEKKETEETVKEEDVGQENKTKE